MIENGFRDLEANTEALKPSGNGPADVVSSPGTEAIAEMLPPSPDPAFAWPSKILRLAYFPSLRRRGHGEANRSSPQFHPRRQSPANSTGHVVPCRSWFGRASQGGSNHIRFFVIPTNPSEPLRFYAVRSG